VERFSASHRDLPLKSAVSSHIKTSMNFARRLANLELKLYVRGAS
jgi:hypothetical protein